MQDNIGMDSGNLNVREIEQGERFPFGENWTRFLSTMNDERIAEAKSSLVTMLEVKDLTGLSFLDIGCGSGLFSLAARQLGARVFSFDYDPKSVASAKELKRRYFNNDQDWLIEEGSVLDDSYMKALGYWDIVYSWGVLHHTGALWQALGNAIVPINEQGKLFIAIYNDQGFASIMWHRIKKTYCSGTIGKLLVKCFFLPIYALLGIARGLIRHKNPFGHFLNYRKKRGMSVYHDWVDWLGGYPFEVAKPEEIFRFCKDAGLELVNLKTTNRLGCNQFVFRRKEFTSEL